MLVAPPRARTRGPIPRSVGVAGALVALMSTTAVASAQDDDSSVPDFVDIIVPTEPEEEFPLEAGPWTATGFAQGRADAAEQGVTVEWRGRIPAQFEFTIDDDGAAVGTWGHQGEGFQTVGVDAGGQRFEATGVLSYSGGGSIGGTNEQLLLSGSTRTTGFVATGFGSFDIDNTNDLPRIELDVTSTSCDEAYGRWALSVEQEFENAGFDATFDGFWTGFRLSDRVQENAADVLAAAGVEAGAEGSEILSASPLLGMSAALLQEYNTFVDQHPNWTLAQVLDIAARTEAYLNVFRNLSDCDKVLFGEDNVEHFINGLTFVIQNLAIATPPDAMTAESFVHLAHVAVRSGAFGPGAPNPALAVRAEDKLIDAAEAILERHVDPTDGLIFVNDETKAVMATGAAMDWTFDVNGTSYPARETYEQNLGETWEPIEGAEGGA